MPLGRESICECSSSYAVLNSGSLLKDVKEGVVKGKFWEGPGRLLQTYRFGLIRIMFQVEGGELGEARAGAVTWVLARCIWGLQTGWPGLGGNEFGNPPPPKKREIKQNHFVDIDWQRKVFLVICLEENPDSLTFFFFPFQNLHFIGLEHEQCDRHHMRQIPELNLCPVVFLDGRDHIHVNRCYWLEVPSGV